MVFSLFLTVKAVVNPDGWQMVRGRKITKQIPIDAADFVERTHR
jgi:hypothetical protein